MVVADLDQSPPRIFSELKPWLQARYISLPRRLQSLAEFVLHNPDMVAMNTIMVISENAGVTASTLVRFAKSIGYQGFSDMQSVFQASMRHIPHAYAQRIHHLDEQVQSETTVLHRFSQAAKASLDKLDEKVDEASLIDASKQLASARCVHVIGQGRAAPVATYLHYMLVKMGIQSVVPTGMPSEMLNQANLIQEQEALVAISFSPYTANTLELVDVCLARRVPVIALMDTTLSPVKKQYDLHLEAFEEEVSGFRGLSATMCLALCLAIETGKRRAQENSQAQNGD